MLTLRLFSLSFQLPRRRALVNLLLVLLIGCVMHSGLFGGLYPITFADLKAAVAGEADAVTEMIVLGHRLPRLIIALGAGLAFGLAGELVQTLLRNPLASPDIIGFSAGASSGAVVSVVVIGSTAAVVPAALAGGLIAALLVISLSWQRGIQPAQVVLIGIGITLTLSVATDLLLTKVEAMSAYELTKWMMGTLEGGGTHEARILWVSLAVLMPLTLWHQFALGRSAMDETVARALGIHLDRSRLITLMLAVLLVATAVTACGPLPFVAFVAGPIAHGLTRDARPTLMSAALVGALITLLADLASRSLPAGFILPTGVFTALVGAPVLIWVLILQSRKEQL